MKLIIKPRQTGKTSELIRMSEETNAYILTPNRMMAEYVSKMAEQQGYNILFPITLNEYMRTRLKGSHVTHILIDNADMVLQQIFNDVTIDAITMSEQEPKWIPVSERLPEHYQNILFSTKTDRVFEGRYFKDETEHQWYSFRDECFAWNNVVTAWMPLPKPYEPPERSDKE